jgi:hypothetical protein
MTCESLSKACVSQAAVLLRLLLESASIIHVLVQNPDLLEEYIKHIKIRLEIGLNPDEESDLLEKYFPDIEKNQRLKYMDYGWFKSKMQTVIRKGKVIEPSVTDLIRLAGFDEIISWKKLYLDKLSHQSYTMLNMIDKNGDIPIVINFIQILCKLFDHVCCDFHAITGFEFIFDGISKFQSEFREIYKKEILK